MKTRVADPNNEYTEKHKKVDFSYYTSKVHNINYFVCLMLLQVVVVLPNVLNHQQSLLVF